MNKMTTTILVLLGLSVSQAFSEVRPPERLSTAAPLLRELTDKPNFSVYLWGPEFRRQIGENNGWGHISSRIDDPTVTTLVEVEVRIPKSGHSTNGALKRSAMNAALERVENLGFDPLSIKVFEPGFDSVVVVAAASDKAINALARKRPNGARMNESVFHIDLVDTFPEHAEVFGERGDGIFRYAPTAQDRRAVWTRLLPDSLPVDRLDAVEKYIEATTTILNSNKTTSLLGPYLKQILLYGPLLEPKSAGFFQISIKVPEAEYNPDLGTIRDFVVATAYRQLRDLGFKPMGHKIFGLGFRGQSERAYPALEVWASGSFDSLFALSQSTMSSTNVRSRLEVNRIEVPFSIVKESARRAGYEAYSGTIPEIAPRSRNELSTAFAKSEGPARNWKRGGWLDPQDISELFLPAQARRQTGNKALLSSAKICSAGLKSVR